MRPLKTPQTVMPRLFFIAFALAGCLASPARGIPPGPLPAGTGFDQVLASVLSPLAVPSNDNFTSAALIEGESGQVTGSNVDATSETLEPVHAGLGGGVSVWWKWTAPASGRWSFDTAGSDFDTVLAVYTGSVLADLVSVAANDDGGPNATSKVVFGASEGTTYSIAVDGYYGFDTGNIVLNWARTPVIPPNDDFAAAIAITGPSGQTTGSNDGAIKEPGEPDHAGDAGGASVWWKWTAPASGSMTLNTNGSLNLSGLQMDTVLAVYTGTRVDDLTLVASNDDADRGANVLTSLVNFSALAGVEYHIAVDGYGGDLGNIILNWLFAPRLPAEIRGSVWEDVDGDGHWDVLEPALADWTVYLGQNGNGQRDSGETFVKSGADGKYVFANLEAGTYLVAEEVQKEWRQTYPHPGVTVPGQETIQARIAAITTTGSKAPIYLHAESAALQPLEGEGMQPSTAQSGPLINLTAFRNDSRFSGINGGGYAVAVLDTGIDLNHPFFGPDGNSDGVADRIVFQYDFADVDPDASDQNGHGSNVCGIVASQDAQYTGMAPAVGVVALKIFSNEGDGDFATVEQALQWVVQNAGAYNIVSVNMSLGDGENHTQPTSLYGIGDEIAALAAISVIVVSSAGNDYAEFLGMPGVSYPAADPNSLAVGAVFDADIGPVSYGGGATAYSTAADRVTPFSQRHETLLSIFAPGAAITNANASGGVTTLHGTSQAAPHIAGIAALAQQLADQFLGRRLTPSEFTGLLKTSGVIVQDGDDEDDNVIHTFLDFPRVNVLALTETILASAGRGAHVVTVAPGETADGLDFGNQGPAIALLITHYYLSALDREPEPGAVEAWRAGYFQYALDLNLNVALITKEMGRIFFFSEEYQNRARTDDEFITDCYRTFVQRTPSDEELAGWLGGIWDRGHAVSLFADSQEHADIMAALFPGCAGVPTRNFVAMMYGGLLDRLVDSNGLSYCAARMDQATDKQAEAQELVRLVVNSAEFLSHHYDSAGVVSRFYRAFFGRFAGQGEIEYWAGELDAGRVSLNSLIAVFTYSAEFENTLSKYF